MKYQAVVFDFDYTLADSSRGVIRCANDALHDIGLHPAEPDEICATIGLSLAETFLTLAGRRHAALTEQFTARFKYHADLVMADLTVLYPTVDPVVRLLTQRGVRLAVVSTKFRYRIEAILRRESLLDLFDFIVGGEDVSKPKPEPEGLCRVMTDMRCPLRETLYVGDSVVDAETAERAGVDFLAVLSGVTGREEFRGYPTVGIIESLSQLPEWLSR
jgi:phosphoglycolate phosphatase